MAQARPPPRPAALTISKGAIAVAATLEVDVTAARAAEPVSLAPDLSYGVSDGLTLVVAHSTFATTGFRGGAGRGVCVTGDDKGCASAYNNVGAEALFSLSRGAVALALNAGVHATNLEDGFYAAKAGIRARLARGPLSVATSPAVLIALTERDAMKPNKDQLFIPIVAMYNATPALAFGAGSGLKGPLDGLGKSWEVPLGALLTYSLSPTMAVGTSLVFGKVWGGAQDPAPPAAPATGQRYRAWQLWATVRL